MPAASAQPPSCAAELATADCRPSGGQGLPPNPLARTATGATAALDECRICLLGAAESNEPLMASPCGCTGTSAAVHLSCLSQWALEKRSLHCELCKQPYREPLHSQIVAHMQASGLSDNDAFMAQYGSAAGGGVGPDGQPLTRVQAVHVNIGTWQNILCHVVALLVMLAVILYLTVFSDFAPAVSNDWTSILWRVLTILIPTYLIGRMLFLVVLRCYHQRAARRAQRRRLEEEAEAVRQLSAIVMAQMAQLEAAEAGRHGQITAETPGAPPAATTTAHSASAAAAAAATTPRATNAAQPQQVYVYMSGTSVPVPDNNNNIATPPGAGGRTA